MKKQKLPNLVYIAVLTVITVFFWIGLDVYRALTVQPPASVSPSVLARLEPTLDQESLVTLSQRVYKETSTSGTTQLRSSDESVILTTPEPIFVEETPEPTTNPVASSSATPLP